MSHNGPARGPPSSVQQPCCITDQVMRLGVCPLEQGGGRAGSQVQQLARLLAGIQRAAVVNRMYVSARLPSLMVSRHPPNPQSSGPCMLVTCKRCLGKRACSAL